MPIMPSVYCLHHLVVLALLSILPLPCSASIDLWQFCHYAQVQQAPETWSVVTSGAFVTDDSSGSRVLTSITGTRTQTDGLTGDVNVSTITGVAAVGSLPSGNDNVVASYWPQLTRFTPGGLGYLISPSVQLPTTSGQTSAIGLYGQPPLEYPVTLQATAVSYFVYEAGNTEAPLACPLPPAVSYSFHYTAVPTTSWQPIWSACMTGTLQLIGPFSMVSDIDGSLKPTYIVTNATGYRLFTNDTGSNGGAAYRQDILNVGVDDGGDFVFYTPFPYFDNAGVTFELNQPSVLQCANPLALAWINLWSFRGYAHEAIYSNPDNFVDWRYTPLAQGEEAYTCPAVVQFPRFYFCHYAESVTEDGAVAWSVTDSGELWTAFISDAGTYQAVAMKGQRLQYAQGQLLQDVVITILLQVNATWPLGLPGGSAYLMGDPRGLNIQADGISNLVADAYNDNLLNTSYPFLSSQGLMFQTLNFTRFPGTNITSAYVGIAGQPAVQYLNASYWASETTFSFFVYQPMALGLLQCGSPRQAINSRSFSFLYTLIPFSSSSSVCSSGILQAQGPYYYPSPDGVSTVTAYIVSEASGTRLLLQQNGSSVVNVITGVGADGEGDFTIYTAEGGDAVDYGGLTFTFDSALQSLNGSVQGSWVNVYLEKAGQVNELGSGLSADEYSGRFQLGAVGSLPSCANPGNELSVAQDATAQASTGVGGIVLAIALQIIATGAASLLLSRASTDWHVQWSWAAMLPLVSMSMAGSLAVCGWWAATLACLASLSLECVDLTCLVPVELSLALPIVLLALLPALLLSWPGFLLINHSLIRRKSRVGLSAEPSKTASQTTQQSLQAPLSSISAASTSMDGTEKLRLSVYASYVEDVRRCRQLIVKQYSPAFFVGSLLVAAGLVVTRVTMTLALRGAVSIQFSALTELLAALLVAVFVCGFLPVLIFSAHLRWTAANAFVVALIAAHEIGLAGLEVNFSPDSLQQDSGGGLHQPWMSEDTCIIIVGVIGGLTLALLLQLQFSQMRSKHRKLGLAMLKKTRLLNSAESQLARMKKSQLALLSMNLEQERTIEAMSLVRPVQDSGSSLATLSLVLSAPLRGSDCAILLSGNSTLRELQASSTGSQAPSSPNRTSTAEVENERQIQRSRALSALSTVPRRSDSEQDEFALAQLEAVRKTRPWSGQHGQAADSLSSTNCLQELSEAFKPTVEQIMCHPLTCELFKDHMYRSHCVENVLFILHVRRYELLKPGKLKRAVAAFIHDAFIKDGSPLEINIEHSQRQVVTQRVAGKKELSADLFTVAVREVLRLIETNNWKSFVASEAYSLCCSVLLRAAAVVASLALDVSCDWMESAVLVEADIGRLLASSSSATAATGDRKGSVTSEAGVEESVPGEDDAQS